MQGIEPQALGLIEQACVVKGRVKLVVKINAKQGEDLINGVDQSVVFNLPSCGR